MSSWTDIIERARPGEHVVQLYRDDEELLATHVSRYLGEGLRRGDGLLTIATPAHTDAFVGHLRRQGADPAAAIREGRFVRLDAEETLSRFMVDGQPSWGMFEQVIGGAIRDLEARVAHGKLRAFGEMVGLLWSAGQTSAATLLEQYWNRMLEVHGITLFCAYPMDLLDCARDEATLNMVVGSHSHVFAGSTTLLSAQTRIPSPQPG
jgi:hypothetical protein